MFNWITSDPDTMWLNITNLVLGVCVLACVAVGVIAVVRDLAAQAKARRSEAFTFDVHSMMIPELGLTMADGGEPVDENKNGASKKG